MLHSAAILPVSSFFELHLFSGNCNFAELSYIWKQNHKIFKTMNYKKSFGALLLAIAFHLNFDLMAQLNIPRPSPNASVTQNIGLAEAKVFYSRPQIKGRKIFGELVPFDKIWRTGANSPTKIVFTDTVSVNGKKIATGEYALYTIPGQAEWTIIFGKNPAIGANEYTDALEVARFKVKPETLPAVVETFTINFTNVTKNTADLEISWEKTLVRFKIVNDYDTKVMSQISQKMGVEAPLYHQAASYYFETNRDLPKALEWITKSTDKDPQFYTLYLKAQIQQKLKDCKGAAETAQKSIELSKKANNEEFVKFNEKLIAECAAKK
jgi:hypothetical protein